MSAVLTAVNRNFADLDLTELASRLEAQLLPLNGNTVAAAIHDVDLSTPTLIQGTGVPCFDAEVAAALGVPLLLVADSLGAHTDLVAQEVTALQAVIGGFFVAEDLADTAKIQAAFATPAAPVMSAELFESWLLQRAKEQQSHIVLPEGEDDRILQAAHQLLAGDIVELTILGVPEKVAARATELGLDLSKANIVDHLTDPRAEEFAATFAELRKKKGVTLEQARETMRDVSYYATMMIQEGLADGMVSGAAHTTAHTIRPAFQIIKTAPGASVVSSIFLMVQRGRLWAFGDCAVNPNPNDAQLAEIAVSSARTAAMFGIDPKVAMLSYSTGSSGQGPDVDAVVAATAKAQELAPELAIDGPLQFDAACDPAVAASKAPDSPVAGHANVFIFPDLQSGNIGYKTAQRTGGALAVGPILQGLNKPINDLSRGATVPDIVNTVAITAIQAGGSH
ncbi:phosphate acetyltransferase [Corynebacterium caspium]|uniref:phosphate acetyltransferase n=1 Tax=Corynebacterium caspium TaxID=234828 RepID=UPI000380DE56|nr:phosphate acetyltransferase [Corynebacterium caspium]WKD58657.1 Phosphate acetyltransferase [Corynebacterium caspium DSM 44850]